jgi:methyl-accepting chemotaxis protein
MKKIVMLLCLFAGAALFAETPLTGKDALIKSEVETAVSMLAALEMKHLLGELNKDEAMQLGADLLRDLRYGEEGYFWADTEEGVNVVLYGRKDVEGRNRIDAKDSDGVYYIRAFLRLAKEGGGFVEYRFPKLGEKTPVAKRSYVKPFKPFGWVIGSGYYKE